MDQTTPVVFLHAFPLNATMWEPQLRALGPRRALAPHFPGFGGRARSASHLDRFAQAVLQAMDAAAIQKAILVGLSMGGYVALRLYAHVSDRIAAMVLADTRAGADDDETRARRCEQASRARREGLGWLQDALLPALLGETTRRERPEVVEKVRGILAQADPEGVARALGAMRSRPDSIPLLKDIQVPVLAIVGEEDTLTPMEEARRIADGVPNGQLTIIPAAGHLSNLEAPDPFNEALLSFLG